MEIPKSRFSTVDAMKAIAKLLNITYDSSMQDWTYVVADDEKIEEYLALYATLKDDDLKFTLMEIIIQATNNQLNGFVFWQYREKLKKLLLEDFELHEYTIFYWAEFDNPNLDDCWAITPYMRELFHKVKREQKEKSENKLSSLELAIILTEFLDEYSLLHENGFKDALETIKDILDTRKAIGDY